MRLSYWEHENLCRRRNVIVVGAGLVGLSAAIEVKRRRPDMSVLVVDRQLQGAAASTRNAGFVCFGSVSEIVSDTRQYGADMVANLVERRRKGIHNLRARFEDSEIGYVPSGGYEVFGDKDEFEKWADQIPGVHDIIGESIFKIRNTPPPLSTYEKSVSNDQEGQLHTGLLYKSLLNQAIRHDVEIVRGISISNVDVDNNRVDAVLYGSQISLHSDLTILASNALTGNYFPDLDVTAVRNQVFITEPLFNHELRGCYHQDRGYIYFRDVEDRILIGGGRHLFKEEEATDFGSNQDNLDFLFNHLQKYILPGRDDIRVAHQWSGILSGGQDRLPIVKQLSDTVSVAVRLGGMGVAIGIDVGIEVATMTLN